MWSSQSHFFEGVVHLWLPAPKLTCARSLLVKILMLAEGQMDTCVWLHLPTRRSGHQFIPDMSSIKHWAGGGPGSSTRRPPQSHLLSHRRQMDPRNHRKTDLITLIQRITGSFPACCLKLLNCSLPSFKYERNFNKEGKNKKIYSI